MRVLKVQLQKLREWNRKLQRSRDAVQEQMFAAIRGCGCVEQQRPQRSARRG